MDDNRFDLNDIQHEPSDEQLDDLMRAVAAEASRRAGQARQLMMARLREAVAAANGARPAP